MPYFIAASGLFSLGMEDGGSRMVDVHPRSGDDASFPDRIEVQEHELAATEDSDGIPISASRVKVSIVAHTRLLLSKMSTTHPAAAIAEKMLEQEMGSGLGLSKMEIDSEMGA
jgi:hypothetical protein